MMQSANAFLLNLQNQCEPSAELFETPCSVNDVNHHSGPSPPPLFIRKSQSLTSKIPKYISFQLLRQIKIQLNTYVLFSYVLWQ